MATEAKACRQALTDATRHWPRRNRASDGILGDARHRARKSDHNSGNAFDLTHDPINGVDCSALCHQVTSDPRVTYIIFNGRIFKRRQPELGWQVYRGPNPHKHHMHVSIKPEARNDTSPWPWSTTPDNNTNLLPVLKLTNPLTKGKNVKTAQARLKAHGAVIAVDGNFGLNTQSAVKSFQRLKGLTQDGIIGAATWKALLEKE